jgi:hypothetical protein
VIESQAPTSKRAPAVGTVCLALALTACGEQHRELGDGAERDEARTLDVYDTVAALERSSVRAAYVALQQAEGARRAGYQVERLPESTTKGQLAAGNPAQRFTAIFDDAWVTIGRQEDWSLGLRLAAIDCGGHTFPVEIAGEARATEVHRLAYDRRAGRVSLKEWYVNGPLGLEQGITLGRAPCDDETLRFRVMIRGLRARNTGAGDRVEFVDGTGAPRLGYAELHAVDARGRTRRTRLQASSEDEVTLEVDIEGAAWPLVIDPLIFAQERKLTASDGLADDEFGLSVAIDGDTAIVGARTDDVENNENQGSAYVFVREGIGWSELQKLTASDGERDDHFGVSVALAGDTALVGATHDDVGSNGWQGSAYVFTRSGLTWSEQQKLVAPDGAANDWFGTSVALSGETALVGTYWDAIGSNQNQGSAHVFVRSGVTWSHEQRLTASDGAADDAFGRSVALSGDIALVGALTDDVGANEKQGSAYVFVRSASTWVEQQRLLGSDSAAGDAFGWSVALAGDTALVGAPASDVGSNANQGSAYVFTNDASTWSEAQKLTSSDGGPGDAFGWSVALANDTALIAAREDDMGGDASQGSAYVFGRSASTWSQRQKLVASDGVEYDYFGWSVALSDDTALVGARELYSRRRGAAYAFRLANEDGDPCSDDAECASEHCVDSRCCNVECAGSCGACSIATGSDVDGVCKILDAGSDGSPPCAPQVCDGRSPTCVACTFDSQCPSGTYCDRDGRCEAQKDRGAPCDLRAGSDCAQGGCRACSSGYCSDGVCCDAQCDGACEACVAALNGDVDGACLPIPADQDPDNECAADTEDSCLRDGWCDGDGACRAFARIGTPCGATECSSGVVTGQVCTGGGDCERDEVPCAPYVCEGESCATECGDDDDCAATAFCTRGGTCAQKKDAGEACSEAGECSSGFCADEVCCDRECQAQCEACAEPASVGVCSAVMGAPRAGRDDCAGDGICAGSCDGRDRVACRYPDDSTACEEGCEDGSDRSGRCDGSGSCAPGTAPSCAPYACGSDGCLTECVGDEDCVAAHRCEEGVCVPMEPNDCCEATAAGPVGNEGGCGCRVATTNTPGPRVFLALLALTTLIARRRVARRARQIGVDHPKIPRPST